MSVNENSLVMRFIKKQMLKELQQMFSNAKNHDSVDFLRFVFTEHDEIMARCRELIYVAATPESENKAVSKPMEQPKGKCSTCCEYSTVPISTLESELIFREIFGQLDMNKNAQEVVGLLKKIDSHNEKNQCIFLNEKRCEIENIRPLKCRLSRPHSYYGLQSDVPIPSEVADLYKSFEQKLIETLGKEIIIGGEEAVFLEESNQDNENIMDLDKIKHELDVDKKNNMPLVLKEMLIQRGYV